MLRLGLLRTAVPGLEKYIKPILGSGPDNDQTQENLYQPAKLISSQAVLNRSPAPQPTDLRTIVDPRTTADSRTTEDSQTTADSFSEKSASLHGSRQSSTSSHPVVDPRTESHPRYKRARHESAVLDPRH